jgi:tRNA pseudouridine32 synthase/23S rRNA pseudouridine746 synthase
MNYQSRIEESEHFLQMVEVEGQPNTDTFIELITQSKPWSKYRLTPGSGKKHQLRCHLNALGIAIKDDQIYPELTPYQEYDIDISRTFQLLAKEIAFQDPITNKSRSFISKRVLEF